MICGGIVFDNLFGIENKVGLMWKFYSDYDYVCCYGEKIMLIVFGILGVKVGMLV